MKSIWNFFEKHKRVLIGIVIGASITIGAIALLIVLFLIIVNILIDGKVNIADINQKLSAISGNLYLIGTVGISVVCIFFGLSADRERKKKEEEEWQEKYFGKYDDVLKRMQLNLESMREFYTWTQKQARMAFRLAVGMCIAGIALICVAIRISNNDMTIISTVGGVVTELIAGTALIVYRRSLSQLNYYHKALHQDQRFLSSVDLLKEFKDTDSDVKNEMRKAIIQGVIDMNRAEVAQPEEEKADKKKSDT